MAGTEGSRFEQRILHARRPLLHGLQGLPNHRGPHFSSAQVPHLFHLKQIKEGITLGRDDELGFFPARQLARRKLQNTK